MLHLHHNSFSNPSLALPMSQVILQPFSRFTYVTGHSPTLLLLHLPHSSFSNPSFTSPTSQDFHLCNLAYGVYHGWLILQAFQSLHLRHNSFSNPSLALSMSQVILQPFHCFTYITAHSPTLLSLLLPHRIFTYVTWRAAHGVYPTSLHTIWYDYAPVVHQTNYFPNHE